MISNIILTKRSHEKDISEECVIIEIFLLKKALRNVAKVSEVLKH